MALHNDGDGAVDRFFSRHPHLFTVGIMARTPHDDSNYGSTSPQEEPASPYHLQETQEEQHRPDDESSLDEEYEMSLTELLYSTSSYHAIVKPGKKILVDMPFVLPSLLSPDNLPRGPNSQNSSLLISFSRSHIDNDVIRSVCHFH